jgi:glycosyltransferase involved in cell wall biosynthesis
MAVWNGGRWLSAQLDSILAQQDVEVTLLCRDDGSTDDSLAILQAYQQQFPAQIRIVRDYEGNLGACGSFSRLMQHALDHELDRAPGSAIALADQDDIWHAGRLSVTLAALREADDYSGPVLVHSDLRVVNEQLEPVAPSLIRYQGLQPMRTSPLAQLLSNSVTGCTLLMNRALLEKALPVPERAIMHDWWLALVVSLYGRRIYIDRPLVDYRQHGDNTVGAKEWQRSRNTVDVLRKAFDNSNQYVMESLACQTRLFRERYRPDIDTATRIAAKLILSLPRWPTPLQKVLFRLMRMLAR